MYDVTGSHESMYKTKTKNDMRTITKLGAIEKSRITLIIGEQHNHYAFRAPIIFSSTTYRYVVRRFRSVPHFRSDN